MAMGDRYNCCSYEWQLRNTENGIMIRYDSEPINANNKGRYNTSTLVDVKATKNKNVFRATTKSGSEYLFDMTKCSKPMHLVALKSRFHFDGDWD